MNEAETLLLILITVYLAECAQWVRLDTVVFSKPWCRAWRFRHPSELFGNQEGAWVWGNPLPPLGPAMVAQWWPLSISPQEVLAFVPQAVNPASLPSHLEGSISFEEIVSVDAKASEIFINGQRFAKVCSPPLATRLVTLIRRLASLPVLERPAAIDRALDRSLDPESVQLRLDYYGRRGNVLWFLCNVLSIFLFAVGGLLVWWPPARSYWPWALCWLLILLVWTVVKFRTVYRALYRKHASDWRMHALLMVFSPMAAIRAYDEVSRYLLSTYHPLAIAGAVCCRHDLVQLARQIVCDLRFPLPKIDANLGATQAETAAWFQKRLADAINRRLQQLELRLDDLLSPPAAEGPDCQTYCPRCRTQYVLRNGACEPCNGTELLPLSV